MRAIVALLVLASAAYAAKKGLTVIVEETKIRKTKAFFAPAVTTVKFGEVVTPSGEADGGWYPVEHDGAEGWIHESAVSTKKVKAGSGKWKGSDDASSDEVTLAGKGFNEKVEKAFRDAHQDLDFGKVDELEGRQVSEKALYKFMKAGGTLGEGEAK
jgi:hypothetical protein